MRCRIVSSTYVHRAADHSLIHVQCIKLSLVRGLEINGLPGIEQIPFAEFWCDGFAFDLRELPCILASHLANLRNLCHLDPTVRKTLNLESIPDDQVILLARRCNVVL